MVGSTDTLKGAANSGIAAGRFQRLMTSPWLLILVVALSFFWQLGAVPLYDLDEGAFTEATREMLASGDFITPHKDGEPRYDKPVLIYWLQAASAELFGFDEFALRLPSAIAATLWIAGLWFFVRRCLDARTATVAGLAMALSLQVSLIAKAAVADAVLNLFIALAFFEIYRYFLDPDPKTNRGFVLRAYLWMGLGFLTKGPVAVFFPLVVSFLFFLSEMGGANGGLRRWFRAVFSPLGWLVFLAVAGPWYLAIYLDDGAGFFRSFFLQHNLGRFDSAMQGHSGFPGYYLVMLPIILLPFSGWFLSLLKDLRRSWSDPLDRFLWIWFLTVLLFFSFSGTQLPHYLLYGCTPLFILMARYRERLTNGWLAFVPPLFLFAILVALPWLLETVVQVALRFDLGLKAHQVAMIGAGRFALDLHYGAAVLAGLVAMLGLMVWSRPALWSRLVLAGIIQTLVVFGVLVPKVFEVMQAPVKEAGLVAKALDMPTVVYRTSMPSFSVYREAVTPNRRPQAGDLVFLRIDKLDRLERDLPDLDRTLVYQRGPVALVMVRAPE
ncbi:ArnT family glycosyltransferase [Imhoffiella purpurea]|uniref:Polymyxin resistance protein ArnT, undecaprenyl phosphate-alpha-L-Ara4N transferase n=1 Tax=Imhoffiella purpurea TaxID=1249627 RepID=W9V414_9GAMM|nr:glycosyltransferase family 39 protein [Imhoffiella purpurea]EXJ14074.1 Polymyxin resistance protein ArnT, undecaprenyl phosphate-alpha-L-Ara4N transferase [Imhoffiella purpurea]